MSDLAGLINLNKNRSQDIVYFQCYHFCIGNQIKRIVSDVKQWFKHECFYWEMIYYFQEAMERYHVALCVQSPARHHSAACYRSVLYVSVVCWTYITLNAKACILTPRRTVLN